MSIYAYVYHIILFDIYYYFQKLNLYLSFTKNCESYELNELYENIILAVINLSLILSHF